MDKLSSAEVGQMTKLAADAIRALSARNQELEAEVAHYRRKEHAEKVAHMMEDKGIQPELSFQEKVAHLMDREDLRVVEEAVGMSTPQMKVAHVTGNDGLPVEGVEGAAATNFVAALASME